MRYGRAIKTIRAARGVTQEELSERSGLDRSYLSKIESGKKSPSLEAVERLANALNTPVYLVALLASDERELGDMSANAGQEIAQNLLAILIGAQKLPRNDSAKS